jgi:adenosylcobinamide-GDP ribazoletransferase
MSDFGEVIRNVPRRFATAWRFLTVIPVGRDDIVSPEEMGRSMAMFPAVGLVLGGILLTLQFVLQRIFPPSLGAVLLITLLVVITGAFHLDGFADVLDGFAGGKGRESVLMVMRDSRIGAVGGAGLVLLLMTKVFALAESPGSVKGSLLLCMPAVGRLSMLQQAAFSRYAREGEGTGKVFADVAGKREFRTGLLITLIPVALLLGLRGVFFLLLVGVVNEMGRRFFEKRLGGVTGDTQGFAGEVGETLFLLCGAALL